MPRSNSEDIGNILESGEFERIVIQRQEQRVSLIVFDLKGVPHIHSNRDGRVKNYSHVYQISEWLERKFGITEFEFESIPTG